MERPFENILVYINGSEESLAAGMAAIIMAKTTGAGLTAMYVVNTRALSDLVSARIFLPMEQEEYRRDLEADGDRYLRHVEKLAQEKDQKITLCKISGSVQNEIKDHIKKNNIDLLVLGGIGGIRSRRDEFLNEAERVMRSSPCPVLLINDDEFIWDRFESL
ncbi:MAG: universal stress protein [Spirochaetales bacterium]|jgi:nucleotide-binding universal stress UspA family protein|nr:universal stress protein [Spirochaetales bacterium]